MPVLALGLAMAVESVAGLFTGFAGWGASVVTLPGLGLAALGLARRRRA